MFLHKFRRTFIAMFWGWVVCNAITLVTWIVLGAAQKMPSSSWMGMFYWLPATAIVITVAWLAVFLPTDCIVAEHSHLRKPYIAGMLGFAFGLIALIAPFLADMWERGYPSVGLKIVTELLPFSLLGGVTGLTAALHVVLKHPRRG